MTLGASGAGGSAEVESHMLFCVPLNRPFHQPASPCAQHEVVAPNNKRATVQWDTIEAAMETERDVICEILMRALIAFMPFCLKKVKISRAPETTGFHTKSTRYERKMIANNSRRGDTVHFAPLYMALCNFTRKSVFLQCENLTNESFTGSKPPNLPFGMRNVGITATEPGVETKEILKRVKPCSMRTAPLATR